MSALFDVWCDLAPRIRVFCWLAWTLVLSVIAACCLLSSGTEGDESLVKQRMANRQLWRSLHDVALAAPAHSDVQEPKTLPFLPLSLQMPNVHLLHWQPSTRGGELALRMPWEAIPPLFAYLADRGMSVDGFSLATANDALILTLTLEPFHEGE